MGNTITEALNKALEEQGDNVLINLASDEYFKSVNPKKLNAEIVKPIFLDEKMANIRLSASTLKKPVD